MSEPRRIRDILDEQSLEALEAMRGWIIWHVEDLGEQLRLVELVLEEKKRSQGSTSQPKAPT